MMVSFISSMRSIEQCCYQSIHLIALIEIVILLNLVNRIE